MERAIAILILLSLAVSFGCAPTISCDKVINPPVGERLAVGAEASKDGPVTQKWLEHYTGVLEACGYK